MNVFRNMTCTVFIILVFMLTAGCTTTAVPPDEIVELPPTNTPEPMDAAEEILRTSLENLAQTNYHYDIQLNVSSPDSEELSTVANVGDFATTNSWQGVTQILKDGETQLSFEYVSAGLGSYYRENETEEWQPGSYIWEPYTFLQIPLEYLHDIELAGSETWEGIPVYRVTAVSPPVYLLAFFVMRDAEVIGELTFSYLIDQETGQLYQLSAAGPVVINSEMGTETTLQTDATVTLSEHGQEVTITLPAPKLTGHTIGEDAISSIYVFDSAFAQDDQQLVVVGGNGLELWDVADLSQMQQTWNIPASDDQDILQAVAIHPDGHTAAVSTFAGRLYLLDLAALETAVSPLPGQLPFGMASLLFSADGTTLVGLDAEGVVNIWGVVDGRHEVTDIHSDSALALTPDGQTLITSTGDTIYLWDWPSPGAEPHTAVTLTDYGERHGMAFTVQHLAVSADGQWLAAQANDQHTRIWSLKQLDAPPNLIETDIVRDMSFSPDGRFLAIAQDNEIQVWQVGNWNAPAHLTGHEDMIWSLAFSADGQKLVSASQDDTVRLWSMADLEFESGD
ncbi:MAG TPA: hypothetical protein PLD25_07955 [Chloroflexota bacterium]|nr:hypothetical protein [Chloroflexota bacterium]HUM68165.1 hypothetical protein [Chloroflexota bacterium]